MSNVVAPAIPLADAHLRSPILQPPTIRDFMAYELPTASSPDSHLCFAHSCYRVF